jgi:hypothetical protein
VHHVVPLAAGLLAIAAVPPPGTTVDSSGFAFGRLGGNIRPYSVTIANTGVVHTSGAVKVGRKHLTSAQLASLNRVATETTFEMLPKATNCAGTLPDVASTYVRVGARTVRVHGNCVSRYARMWKALTAAVRISP